jgi:endonuclease/exonuclease/phosphatase (EEP) superfamily protein YafD
MRPRLLPQVSTASDTLRLMGRAGQDSFDQRLKILVWNMYKGKRPGWVDDFRTMSEGQDLVLLQEAILNTRFDPLFIESEQAEWVMAKTHGYARTKMESGVKTGSSVKSLTQVFFVSPDVEPILKTPKMVLATTYPIKGLVEPLLVVNIHAINFVTNDKFSRQVAQLVVAMESHVGPIILAGDFNTWNNTRFNSLMDITQKMGLQPVDVPRKASMRHLSRHLDHIFYRGLKLVKAKALTDVRTSDHIPLAAEFTIES